jgi:hypothetical protein
MSDSITDGERLWREALKSFGRAVDIDNKSLVQILEAYLKQAVEGIDPPKDRRARILNHWEPDVRIPYRLAFLIFMRLRTAKGGRPPVVLSERLKIDSAIRRGRKRKAELIAAKMPRGKAHEQAALEVEEELRRSSIYPSAAHIRNRLYGSK